MATNRDPWYLFTTLYSGTSRSSNQAVGVRKSLGLARPLAPIGPLIGHFLINFEINFFQVKSAIVLPRLGSSRCPPNISATYPLESSSTATENLSQSWVEISNFF